MPKTPNDRVRPPNSNRDEEAQSTLHSILRPPRYSIGASTTTVHPAYFSKQQ